MAALGGMPGLDQGHEQDMSGLGSLAGLEAVTGQLAGMIAVLRAEQARRQAGTAISRRRRTWCSPEAGHGQVTRGPDGRLDLP